MIEGATIEKNEDFKINWESEDEDDDFFIERDENGIANEIDGVFRQAVSSCECVQVNGSSFESDL